MKITNEMLVLFPELIEIVPFGYREFCLNQSAYSFAKEAYDSLKSPRMPNMSEDEVRRRQSAFDDWMALKNCLVYDTKDWDSLVRCATMMC